MQIHDLKLSLKDNSKIIATNFVHMRKTIKNPL